MVLKNDGQNAQSEDNGKTFQAGGDISISEVHNHNGMSQSDVIALVNELVSSKVAQYTAEAKFEFENRISSFTNDFYQKMVGQKSEYLLNRFTEPSIQTSYRTAAIQYGLSGDAHKKDILVDLLLDRFDNQDLSMDSIALDRAIANIDQITNKQVDLLTFFAAFIFFIPLLKLTSFKELAFYIEELSALILQNKEITRHDISFLKSAGYIEYQEKKDASSCIRVLKSYLYDFYKELFFDAGVDWEINVLIKQSTETDIEKRFFPNFIRACDQLRQSKIATTRITPAGTMLARKNISLKISQFPKIVGILYGE